MMRTLLYSWKSSYFSHKKILMLVITVVWLTVSTLQIKPDTFVNSVDPDEMAHNELSQQDLHCFPF